MAEGDTITIEGLDITVLESRTHVVPAMKDGDTVKLTLAQILGLLIRGDLPAEAVFTDVEQTFLQLQKFDAGAWLAGSSRIVSAAPAGEGSAALLLYGSDGTRLGYVGVGAADLHARLVSDNGKAIVSGPLGVDFGNSGLLNPGLVAEAWAFQPIGGLVAIWDNVVGIDPPPTNKAYRYLKLSASDAYNTGITTGQTVSGSAPNITATAVVSLADSPLNGRTIRLINTERRFLRPGSPTVLEESQNDLHNHTFTGTPVANHSHTLSNGIRNTSLIAVGTGGADRYVGNAEIGSTGAAGGHTPAGSISNQGGNEARPRNVGVNYYMRVL